MHVLLFLRVPKRGMLANLVTSLKRVAGLENKRRSLLVFGVCFCSENGERASRDTVDDSMKGSS